MTKIFSKLSHRYASLGVGTFSLIVLLIMLVTFYAVQNRTHELREELTNSLKNYHTQFVIDALRNDSLYMSNRLFNPLHNFDISTLNEEVKRIFEWLSPEQILILDSDGLIVSNGQNENPSPQLSDFHFRLDSRLCSH